jgi:hypothetical protein
MASNVYVLSSLPADAIPLSIKKSVSFNMPVMFTLQLLVSRIEQSI